jgi:hypothetical protein
MTKQEKIEILKKYATTKANIYQALEKLDCKYGIEIGVRTGSNLKNLEKNLKFKEGMLFGVDCWTEDSDKPEINDVGFTQDILDQQFMKCVVDFSLTPFVKIIRNYSYEASFTFPDNYFDFIYIDAAHDYESMVVDLNAWWPKLKPGGILSGHDYIEYDVVWRGKKCEVYRATNEFAIQQGVTIDYIEGNLEDPNPFTRCPSFFIIK